MAEAGERAEWVKRPAAAIEGTNCTLGDYQSLYARSVEDTDAFWAGQAERLDWFAQPTKIANWSFDPVAIKWFEDGALNICHNAVDRHVDAGHGDRLVVERRLKGLPIEELVARHLNVQPGVQRVHGGVAGAPV